MNWIYLAHDINQRWNVVNTRTYNQLP